MTYKLIKKYFILLILIFPIFFGGCSFVKELSPKEMDFNRAVKLYKSDNAVKRTQALEYFYKSGKPEARNYFEKAVNDKDSSVRSKAIDTVVKFYGADSSDILFEKLFDSDKKVKEKVEKYVIHYKNTFKPLITKKLNSSNLVNDQIKAIRAIKIIGDESYIGILGDLLFKDVNIYIKLEAMNTLSSFDNEMAQDYIVKSLEANDYSKLIVVGLKSIPKDESIDTIEILIPHLNSPKYQVVIAALKALKENNNKKAVEPIFMMLENTNMLGRQEVIDECIVTLSSLGGIENVDWYLNALDSNKGKIRTVAVKSAVMSKDSPWAERVINKALNNSQKDVQVAAMFAVKEHQSKQSIQDLVNLLNDENPVVRESAIDAVSRIKNAVKYQESFKKSLNDPDYSVVRATIKSLGNVKADWAVNLLKEVTLNTEDENLNITAIHSLANFGDDPGVIRLLENQLNNTNSKIADASSFALAKIRNTASKQVLLDSLKSNSSDVKIRAINALQLLGDPSVVSKLQQCANDLDPKVRKKAKLALNYLVNTQKMREIRNRGLK